MSQKLINYFKIYSWQGASFVLRFVSMFIVMPYLTREPSVYGIFAVCSSITLFLSYADLGFLRAGQKYAAESYAAGNRSLEMKFIGFGGFVLIALTLLLSLLFFFFSLNPTNLISGLDSQIKVQTASQLLLILSVFSPIISLQRVVGMVFEIRLEGFISQRVFLFSNLISIISVFYFFRPGHYDLVSYFLFLQIANLIAVILVMWIGVRRYSYAPLAFFNCFRFDMRIFKKVKGLALSGLYVMVVWVFFYEMDQITIGRILGADKVAIYSVAFVIAMFFRSIFGILFQPFSIHANYFTVSNDTIGLRKFISNSFNLTTPIVLLPCVAFAMISKPMIVTWVGPNYHESVLLAVFFSLLFSLSAASYTGSIVLVAQVRLKEMYVIATVQPLIFWIGVALTYPYLGLLSFAIFKFIATIVSDFFYLYIIKRFLGVDFFRLLATTFKSLVLPVLFIIITLYIANENFQYTKSTLNLFYVLVVTGFTIALSFVILYACSAPLRLDVQKLVLGILKKAN